jgi:hypothetical protein
MTNPDITIEKTTLAHIRDMAEVMQEQTSEIAKKMGAEPRRLLWQSYKRSFMCKSVFINGKIAAIFGISGVLYGDVGMPWLILSDEVNEYPFRVAFMYKRELNKMQEMFPILQDYVDETNKKAIRMLELMGFQINKNKIQINDAVLLKAERVAS